MTSQKDQIQALIAEIDGVLKKTTSRLPWVMPGEIAQQRQVLEQVRSYLVVLQQQFQAGKLRQGDAPYSASPAGYPPEFYPSGTSSLSSDLSVDAQHMMQTILQEMSYLRASVMQPMQADLESLRQRRELLTREVSQLETERQNQRFAQLPGNQQQFTAELVQVLMSRLQESLSQQIGQTLNSLRIQPPAQRANSLRAGEPSLSAFANPQYEQLQALRSRSDQMLVNLDATLNSVFESLQRNIQTYQESLTQGVERMYSLGKQSETAFKALADELAQQLNQEASSYLLSIAQGQAAINTEAGNLTVQTPFSAEPAGYEGEGLPAIAELDAVLENWLKSSESGNFNVDPSNLPVPENLPAPEPEIDKNETADLEDTFKLLEEFSGELNDSFTSTHPQNIDLSIDPLPTPVQSMPLEESIELDEFYQSLFGDANSEPEAISPLSDPPRSDDFFPEDLFPETTVETETTSITELPATELPASLFEDLSISDPASDQSTESFPLTVEVESFKSDLESFPLEPDSMGSFADLFEDLPSETAQSRPISPPTIASGGSSLQSDEPASTSSDRLLNGLPDSEFALERNDEQFTRAALDENLLPDAPRETGNTGFNLDDSTLSSLSEDLSNLETSATWQSDEITSDFPSLDDLALSFANESQETVERADPSGDRADLTVEDFGTLFDEAPSNSPSLPSLQEAHNSSELFSSIPELPLPPQISFPQVADDGSLPFTLEGMDDLFEDAPSIEPVSAPSLPPRPLATEIAPYQPNNPADSMIESLSTSEDVTFSLRLDEAFESLLGKPIAPPTPPSVNEPPSKKKSPNRQRPKGFG